MTFFGFIFGLFSRPFLDHFLGAFGDPFQVNEGKEVEPLFERLWEAQCGYFGSLFGFLGALLEGLVFQIYCEKQYETHASKSN